MASEEKEAKRRHNPVESLCRKIRTIQRREASSSPAQQMIRYQSSICNSPQTKTKKTFRELLRKVSTTDLCRLDTGFSGSLRADPLSAPLEAMSPGNLAASHPSEPEGVTCSVAGTSSEDSSWWRAQVDQSSASWTPQSSQGEGLPGKDLDDYCRDDTFSASSGEDSMVFAPWDLVVRKLSLNGDSK